MKSFLSSSVQTIRSKSTELLTPTSSKPPSPGPTATTTTVVRAPKGTLFPSVDPAIDGPNCLLDCSSCTIRYPAKFSIDEDDELYGHVNGWATHVLVATGRSDWLRDVVEDEKGSVMWALGTSKVQPRNGRLMISASNMAPPPEYHDAERGHQPTTVLVLPAFTLVQGVRPDNVEELVRRFIDPGPTTTTPLIKDPSHPDPDPTATTPSPSTTQPQEDQSHSPSSPPQHLTSRPCPHSYLILLCSQKTRDARCGQSAPLLRREFQRHLQPLGLHRDLDDDRPGGVGIYFISHVGGHKYSANVMVYRREAGQAIWLARVRPEDCEGIVKYTILEGKVVKPERQLRGGFDRGRGLVSW